MVWLFKSMIETLVLLMCAMRSPFTATVLTMGSRAVFENAPANFIMLAIIPPVILVVCS
jgi:hypothetical protein